MSDDPYTPTCDACGLILFLHGDTIAGQACDISLALADLAHAALKAVGLDYIELRKTENRVLEETR